MATVRKGILVPASEWWGRHLRSGKRLFWKRQRRAEKRLAKTEAQQGLDRRRLFAMLAGAAVTPVVTMRESATFIYTIPYIPEPPTIFYTSPYIAEPMTLEQCEVVMREVIDAGMFDRVRGA